jgi:anti-sigma B factor antagonist
VNTATRTNKGTTIVDVEGNINSSNSRALRNTLLESLKDTHGLAINLIAVKYIDSSGLASLLEVLKEARDTQKKLVLFGLTVAVSKVLQLTRLNGVFEIYETEDEVLNALR